MYGYERAVRCGCAVAAVSGGSWRVVRGRAGRLRWVAATCVLLACSAATAKIVYVDDDAPGDPVPGDPAVSDPLEDGSAEHPFDAIQQGISKAAAGDTVLVADGVYTGTGNKNLDFSGKGIAVRSASGDPTTCIIDCQGAGSGFIFDSGETGATVVSGVTIRNANASGVVCSGQCSSTLTNCTISGNASTYGHGGGVRCSGENCNPTLTNCTITRNTAAYGGGVDCAWGAAPKLVSCAISGNTASASSGYGDGGGVYSAEYARPTLWNCTISGNTAVHYGGGVYGYQQSNSTLTNCVISENAAQAGGGVYCESYTTATTTLTLINCTMHANTATGYSLGGGGVCCTHHSTLALKDCEITGNTASHGKGGGVFCRDSTLTLAQCAISANTAPYSGRGGGLHCDSSSATLTNCAIRGNGSSGDGGGVSFANASSVTLAGCEISDNKTGYRGGGVYYYGQSSPTVTNCTITGNTARDGGGLYVDYGSVKLTNCILWGNATPDFHVYSGAPVVTYCDIRGGYPGTGNFDLDPRFSDPDGPDKDPTTWQDNDYHLAGGSPCIDAGDNGAVPADTFDLDGDYDTLEPLPLDLDRRARFVDVPGRPDTGVGTAPIVDLGAYEVWVVRGDANCDGGVDFDDIDGFVLALASHQAYVLAHPGCPYESADTNADGYVDFDDINPFVICLVNAGCP